MYSRVDAVNEDLLCDVTRSVSLLARGRPIGLLDTDTVSIAAPPLSASVRRFSGLRVWRMFGLRLRGADRCSRVPTDRFGGLWDRVLGGRTAVARDGRMLPVGGGTDEAGSERVDTQGFLLVTPASDVTAHSAV